MVTRVAPEEEIELNTSAKVQQQSDQASSEPVHVSVEQCDEQIENSKKQCDEKECIFYTVIRPILAEFVGEIFFVYMICLTSFSSNPLAGLGVGLTLFVVICWFAHISGGHFNPAVTAGVLLAGQIKVFMAAGYIIAQLCGAIIAGLLYRASVPREKYELSVGGSGTLTLPNDVVDSISQVYLIEVMMTTILVFTVLMVGVDSEGSKSFLSPFAIGTVVSLDAVIGGSYTGASMNPARSFGPAVTYSGPVNQWENHWVFWAAPLTGSVLAALMYRLMFAEGGKRCGQKDKVALIKVFQRNKSSSESLTQTLQI